MTEKSWSLFIFNIDHSIDFMGLNWLVNTNAYLKYPCIHPTASISTKATCECWKIFLTLDTLTSFIVFEKATSFTSDEFYIHCRERNRPSYKSSISSGRD